MRLTFKKEYATGRMAIGNPHPNVDIKLDGKVVGFISSPNWQSVDNLWRVRLAVVKSSVQDDGNPNCPWTWKVLKPTFPDERTAREYLKEHKESLEKLNLHRFED